MSWSGIICRKRLNRKINNCRKRSCGMYIGFCLYFRKVSWEYEINLRTLALLWLSDCEWPESCINGEPVDMSYFSDHHVRPNMNKLQTEWLQKTWPIQYCTIQFMFMWIITHKWLLKITSPFPKTIVIAYSLVYKCMA